MRSLTNPEARAIRILLARGNMPERQQLEIAGLPRTTYQTIRLRAQLKGWVRERYIPDPRMFGMAGIHFVLAQPFGERWSEVIARIRSFDGVVVLWLFHESILAVLFERATTELSTPRLHDDGLSRLWTVTVTLPRAGILAYFDFEGSWSNMVLDGTTFSYPQGLPSGFRKSSLSPRERTVIQELLLRPFSASMPELSRRIFGSFRVSHQARRMVDFDWIQRRVLPDYSGLPSFRGRGPRQYVFVTGVPGVHLNPEDLFSHLVNEAHVSPFLFVFDNKRVLIGAVSPAPASLTARRSSVSNLLEASLEKIEVVREPVDGVSPLVDHQYFQLIDRVATQNAKD